jgi:hypothetical protein
MRACGVLRLREAQPPETEALGAYSVLGLGLGRGRGAPRVGSTRFVLFHLLGDFTCLVISLAPERDALARRPW